MKFLSFFKFTKEFGIKTTLPYFFNNFLFRLTKRDKFKIKVHNIITRYLDKNYSNILQENTHNTPLNKNYKVWVFWWQGELNAPELVQSCINSIRTNFQNNEVIVLDKNNYSDYIDIPDYIMDKVKKKIITITHLSDIVRSICLSKYGGIWLDATLYFVSPIDNLIQNQKFYTVRQSPTNKTHLYVSQSRWTGFCMAGCKNNALFVNLKNVLFEYWKKHNQLINYFLIDYIINLQYIKCDSINKMINEVPLNNVNIQKLYPELFNPYSEEKFKQLCKNTNVFKLSYKFNLAKTNTKSTFYQKIIENQKSR